MLGIIGLGWIGLNLAQRLNNSYEVIGTVSSIEKVQALKPQSITLFQWLWNTPLPEPFARAQSLVITIPPASLELSGWNHFPDLPLIYLSSTVVFGEHQKDIDELTPPEPDSERGRKQLLLEQALIQTHPSACILRLGGLIGEDRHPGKFLAGKKNLENPSTPVNLIHREDVVHVIETVLRCPQPGEIFHVVCDEHSSRKEFYQEYARRMNLTLPEFNVSQGNIKRIISNQKLKQQLHLKFKHPHLLGKAL